MHTHICAHKIKWKYYVKYSFQNLKKFCFIFDLKHAFDNRKVLENGGEQHTNID